MRLRGDSRRHRPSQHVRRVRARGSRRVVDGVVVAHLGLQTALVLQRAGATVAEEPARETPLPTDDSTRNPTTSYCTPNTGPMAANGQTMTLLLLGIVLFLRLYQLPRRVCALPLLHRHANPNSLGLSGNLVNAAQDRDGHNGKRRPSCPPFDAPVANMPILLSTYTNKVLSLTRSLHKNLPLL